MSGSPIIRDGKLVGAVTHVLVNAPTRGYGIFIENMLEGRLMDFCKVPLGSPSMNSAVLNTYSAMREDQQQGILSRVRNARSEEEMHRIVESIAG